MKDNNDKKIKLIKTLVWTFIFPLVFLFLCLVIPSKQVAIMPGEVSLVTDELKLEGLENNNFYTVSVYVWKNPQALFTFFMSNSKNDVKPETPYDQSITKKDSYQMGQVSKRYSHSCAIINAYTEASKIDPSIEVEYEVNSLSIYYRDKNMDLVNIGDTFTHFNGVKVSKENYQELINLSKTSSTFDLKKEDQSNLKIDYLKYLNKNGKSNLYSKIVFLPNIEITKTTPHIDIVEDISVGGPSGGLMNSLSIYVSLLKLNIKDVKIAGTGTINLDGSVGKIGGAPQKIHTANKAKMDVFFIPDVNHNEVIDIDKNFNYHVVSTFSDAVKILTENYLMK